MMPITHKISKNTTKKNLFNLDNVMIQSCDFSQLHNQREGNNSEILCDYFIAYTGLPHYPKVKCSYETFHKPKKA